MTIETSVYKLLTKNQELITLLNDIRGKPLPDGHTGVWKHTIPENYQKKENAPFIRLNPIYEADYTFSDDDAMAEEQRIQLSWWCETDTEAELIKNKVDEILKGNNFTRYTANENPRYKDTDIDLLMNVRKYRFFDWEI